LTGVRLFNALYSRAHDVPLEGDGQTSGRGVLFLYCYISNGFAKSTAVKGMSFQLVPCSLQPSAQQIVERLEAGRVCQAGVTPQALENRAFRRSFRPQFQIFLGKFDQFIPGRMYIVGNLLKKVGNFVAYSAQVSAK
jgi:hypothetical protein